MNAMIAKLSKRERALLYILALFLLVIGSYLFLSITISHYNETLDTVEALSAQKSDIENRLAMLPALNADLNAYPGGGKLELYKFSTPYDLDLYLTGMILRSGLHPVSVTYGSAEWITLPTQYKARVPGSSVLPLSSWEARVVKVQVTCRGDVSAFLALAQTFSQNDALYLTSARITEGETANTFIMQITIFLDNELRKK